MPVDPSADQAPSPADLLERASYRSTGIGSNQVLTCRLVDGCLTLTVAGQSSDALPDRLAQGLVDVFRLLKPRRAAIDLSGAPSLPSVVLAFLVFFHKTAEEHGVGSVVIYGVSPRVGTLLKMIGMSEFFITVADEAAMHAWHAEHGR